MVSGGFINCPCGVSSTLGRAIGLGDGEFEGSGAGGKDSVGEGSGSGRGVKDGASAAKLNNIPYAMEISKISIADSVKNPRLVTALEVTLCEIPEKFQLLRPFTIHKNFIKNGICYILTQSNHDCILTTSFFSANLFAFLNISKPFLAIVGVRIKGGRNRITLS